MTWIALIIALLAVALVVVFGKRHARAGTAVVKLASGSDSCSRLVVPTESSCQAARALNGKIYAAGQAPRLPLEGCTSVHCACSFAPFSERRVEERRSGQDRRENIRLEDTGDRRMNKDRRSGKHHTWDFNN